MFHLQAYLNHFRSFQCPQCSNSEAESESHEDHRILSSFICEASTQNKGLCVIRERNSKRAEIEGQRSNLLIGTRWRRISQFKWHCASNYLHYQRKKDHADGKRRFDDKQHWIWLWVMRCRKAADIGISKRLNSNWTHNHLAEEIIHGLQHCVANHSVQNRSFQLKLDSKTDQEENL